MARLPKSRPLFIKVLVGEFAKELKIPPAFVKNFKENVPTEVTLESHPGEGRRSWHVKVRLREGGYYFCSRWPAFVRDHGLEEGDFLIFTMLGNSTFYVRIVGRTCCEKKISLAAKRNRGRSPVTRPNHKDTPTRRRASTSSSKKERGAVFRRERNVDDAHDVEFVSESLSDNPSCEVIFKKYHDRCINVPKSFARAARLTEKSSIDVEDPRGGVRTLGINLHQNQVLLSAGWSSLRKDNKLVHGDKLLFQFNAKKNSLQIVNSARDDLGQKRSKQANACREKNIIPVARRERGQPRVSVVTRLKHEETPAKRGISSFSSKSKRGATVRRERNVDDDFEFISESPSEYPSFEVFLKEYHKNYMVVPRSFAKAAGLTEKRSMVMIQNPGGRMWRLGILKAQGQIRLSAGWPFFRKKNELVEGDSVQFQFIAETDSIRFRIINRAGDGGSDRKRIKRSNAC